MGDKNFGFGLTGLKKFPELIPLVVPIAVAVLGGVAMCGYSLMTKTDVSCNRSSAIPPWEKVNPEVPQKLVTFNTKYAKIPELESLRKELGSFKTR